MTATKKAAPVLEHRDGQRVEKKSLQALSTPILLNRRELSNADCRFFRARSGKRH